jgi:hypothetical protein
MASFTAGTTFVDGVSNDVTAAKLGNLVTNATPTSGFIQDRTQEVIIATNDTLLIGDASDSSNLKRMTVANFAETLPTAKVTTGTIETGTFGTTTSTAATITTGTIETGTFGTTTSTAATITTGTIPTLVATTLITTGTGTAAAPAIVPTGDTNTGIFFPAADTIAFSEGGTEGMRIDSSGNVGIGTTSPSARLHVSGSGINAVKITGGSNVNEGSYALFQKGSTDRLFIGVASAVLGSGSTSNDSIVWTESTNNTLFYNNGTERLRIDGSGNVGIGTTSPSLKLTVASDDTLGGILVTGSNAPGIRLNDTTDGNSYSAVFAQNGGVLYISADALNTAANSSIRFEVDQAERLRIDSSGNVGIGTTSPGAKFGVSDGTVNIQLSPDSANSRGVIGTTGGHSIAYAPNGTTRLTIDQANGTLTSQPTYDNTAAGSTVVVTSAGLIRRTSSSLKYKKDIENLDSSIVENAIDRLRPVWYRTKNPEGDDKSTWSHVGLIAEEVDSVEPRLVKYKTVEVSIGENGERIETQLEIPIPEDVDYAKLSVILLSEVKAQRIKIASLEARLEALEAK